MLDGMDGASKQKWAVKASVETGYIYPFHQIKGISKRSIVVYASNWDKLEP